MARLAVGVLVVMVLLSPSPMTLRAKAGDVVAVTELIRNRSFERDSDGDRIPDHWEPHNLGIDDGMVLDAYRGSYSFKIVGEQGITKYLRQTIEARIPSGTRLEFTAYSKAEGASPGRIGGPYKFELTFVFEDNTSRTVNGRFRRGTHDWEATAAGGFVFFQDVVETKVSIVYSNQTGTAWFDLTHFGMASLEVGGWHRRAPQAEGT